MLDAIPRHAAKSSEPRWECASVPPYVRAAARSRLVIWRYDFFNHGGAPAADYAVVVIPSAETAAQQSCPVSFQRVPGVAGPGGEISLAFESTSPIPLNSSRTARYMLCRRQQILLADLPTPGLDFSDGKEDGEPCCRHFIHL